MNTNFINKHPLAKASLLLDDPLQAILDIAYGAPQSTSGWSYVEMLTIANKQMGEEALLFIMLGKWNQQVGNGGHCQYFTNGYAGGKEDFPKETTQETPLHQHMVTLFQQYNLQNLPKGNEVLEILKDFHVDLDADNTVTSSCDNCGGCGSNDDEVCSECSGTSGAILRIKPTAGTSVMLSLT